jgi:hypothetical protein
VEQEQEQEQEREREARTRVDSGDIETDRRRGNDFMLAATTKHWQGYDQQLQLIGAKSERERRAALEAIRRDPWCQANMTKCSPLHVLRKWNDYSAGAPPMQQVATKPADPQLAANTSKLGSVLLQLEAARKRARDAAPDSWERVQANNEIGELEGRANRLKSVTSGA